MDRMLRMVGLLTLSAMALVVVDACASNAGHMLTDAGSMLMDASTDGSLLHDAGSILMDAGTSIADSGQDASAQSGGIDSRSGSRLTARRVAYVGADGSRYDTGMTEFTDAQLGVICSRSPYPMTDGSYRCVPQNPATPVSVAADLFYSDAACSIPLGYRTASACGVSEGEFIVVSLPGETCASPYSYQTRVFRLGARHVGTYYVHSGINCTAQTQSGGTEFYAIGSEALPSAFVEFTDAP